MSKTVSVKFIIVTLAIIAFAASNTITYTLTKNYLNKQVADIKSQSKSNIREAYADGCRHHILKPLDTYDKFLSNKAQYTIDNDDCISHSWLYAD